MIKTLFPVKSRWLPASHSHRSLQTAGSARSSYLLDRRWRPYRNSSDLAMQVYELTHPENVQTYAELERAAELERELELYRTAVLRLSSAMKEV